MLHTVQDITLQYQRNFLEPFITRHFTPANLDAAFKPGGVVNSQVRNLTQEDVTQLAADLVLIRINNDDLIRNNRRLKDYAINLLKYVNEEFHPE